MPAPAPGEAPRLRVCFMGQAGYGRPLDATSARKFRLLAAAADVTVVGFARGARPRRFREHADFWLLPRLPSTALRQGAMLGLGTLAGAWLVLRGRADVVVAQSPFEGVAASLAVTIGRWCGRPARLVVESHGDFETAAFHQRSFRFRRLYGWMMRRAARFSLARAHALRSISGATTDQLARWAPGTPVVQFPAWTDMDAFTGAERVGTDARAVLFVGTLTPVKGVHHLLAAFAAVAPRFPAATLTLLGKPQNPGYVQGLRDEVARLGLEDRVRFAAPVPQAELAGEMARSAVLVLPSVSEGLGRVVFEAMATGTPVIGSAVGGIPELVDDGRTGWLVPPGDEAALAARLAWVLEHPAEAAAAGARARVFATGFFSSDGYVRNYQRLFAAARRGLPALALAPHAPLR